MRLSAWLALMDLRAERWLAACTTLSLSAVLAPLLILAGLRAGVVEGLRDLLLQDPRAREITTAANRSYDAALLDRLATRPDVAFLAPRTRTLAATLLVETPERPPLRIELIPTAPGDPLLAGLDVGGSDQVVLSASAAARLQATAGDPLTARLARVKDGTRQSVTFPLRITAVAPPAAFSRDAAFVALNLAVLVEDFQDGLADIPTNLTALPTTSRADYAGFRLYARRLEDVPALDAALQSDGIEIVSRAADVAGLLRVDRNLGLLFGLVAGLGGAGFLLSLGAGLWANVVRKRVPLAHLRFLGLSARALGLFPVTQAVVLAALGVALAWLAAWAASLVVNHAFAGTLALDRPLCVLSPHLALVAACVTLGGAALVASAAGWRAARVEPWEGINTP